MKKKSMLIVAIILMSIGFAAISTTLVINGNAKISENNEDFSVIFTAASLDGKDVYSTVVDSTKKIITFETSELKTLNQTSVLNYEVTNNSSNYDAEVTITCVPKEGTQAKYTSIKNKLENDATVVKAKTSVNGSLTITLDKTSTESVTEEYTCKLEFSATERNIIGKAPAIMWVPTYFGFGGVDTSSSTDYKTLGKNVFAALGANNSKGICINDNGLFCLKATDYDNSIDLLKEHFGEETCRNSISSFYCSSDAFFCNVNSYGMVSCEDLTTENGCGMNDDFSFYCN